MKDVSKLKIGNRYWYCFSNTNNVSEVEVCGFTHQEVPEFIHVRPTSGSSSFIVRANQLHESKADCIIAEIQYHEKKISDSEDHILQTQEAVIIRNRYILEFREMLKEIKERNPPLTLEEVMSKYDEFQSALTIADGYGRRDRLKCLVKDIDAWLDQVFINYLHQNAQDPTATVFHNIIAARLRDLANNYR